MVFGLDHKMHDYAANLELTPVAASAGVVYGQCLFHDATLSQVMERGCSTARRHKRVSRAVQRAFVDR
ncbi:MAG: hypothetical protein KatS3mg010_1748 [Acidimicrobiia bacterium]|nr:MAG: hypothetical protein KatS3mg010_1748 [Acidimicrobiia bacterium]